MENLNQTFAQSKIEPAYKDNVFCRVCNTRLLSYLDLGDLPLSNNLAESETDPIHDQVYPLKVMFCPYCLLSQLSIVVPRETLFSNYTYRSSMSETFRIHCREMAKSLKNEWGLNQGSIMVDIAGNDCALLNQFKEEIGLTTINVDPAKNLEKFCREMDIDVIPDFWGMAATQRILKDYGFVDLITATNVFAHVDDVYTFLVCCKRILSEHGILVLEFPYLIDFIVNKEFDTVYFEHLSYFSINPLQMLCKQIGLSIVDIEKLDIHGGSIRVTIGSNHYEEGKVVREYIFHERDDFGHIERYIQFAKDVDKIIGRFQYGIDSLGDVAGFAASAKGNTLLNCARIGRDQMKYIVDQTPEKIGKWSPGTRIPIVDIDMLKKDPPKYLVILSWNFADEIMRKCRAFGYQGKFVIPIPEFRIID